jgi:hypothetical protein
MRTVIYSQRQFDIAYWRRLSSRSVQCRGLAYLAIHMRTAVDGIETPSEDCFGLVKRNIDHLRAGSMKCSTAEKHVLIAQNLPNLIRLLRTTAWQNVLMRAVASASRAPEATPRLALVSQPRHSAGAVASVPVPTRAAAAVSPVVAEEAAKAPPVPEPCCSIIDADPGPGRCPVCADEVTSARQCSVCLRSVHHFCLHPTDPDDEMSAGFCKARRAQTLP